MSIAFQKFNSFVEALAEKQHNLGSDTLMIALTNVAPIAGNSVLTDITQISYTGLSSRALTVTGSAQTSGTYKLTVDDLTLTASETIPTFRYIVLYNDTALNKELIGFYDYGSAVDLVSGNLFICDFDGVNGVLQLA